MQIRKSGDMLRASWVIVAASATVSMALPGSARAATYYWNGVNGGTAPAAGFNLSTNWAANLNNTGLGAVPTAADIAFFSVTGAATVQTLNLNAPQSVAGITFNAGNTTLNTSSPANVANTLTIGSTGISVAGGSPIIAAPVLLGSSQSWTHTGGNFLTLSGGLDVGATTLTLNSSAGAGAINVSGALTGSGAITSNRAARFILASASNNYTGTITMNAGSLVFGSAGATGGVDKNKITLTSTANYATGIGANYAIDQAFLTNTIGTSTAGNSFYVGLGVASGNNLDFSATALAGATLGAVANSTYTGTLTPNGTTYRLGGGGATLTMNGPLAAGNNLAIAPTATVVLNPASANAFNGAIAVGSGSTLNTTTNGLGSASSITFANGGGLGTSGSDLSINAPVAVTAGNMTFTATHNISLSGALTGGFTKNGAGTLTLSGNDNNTSSSGTLNAGVILLSKNSSAAVHALTSGATVNGATLRIGNTTGDQIADTLTLGLNTGLFDLNGASETINSITGAGTVTNSAAATSSTLTLTGAAGNTLAGAVLDGAGTLGLKKQGTTSFILTGANGYTGGTTIENGTIAVANGSAQAGLSGTATNANRNIVFTTLPAGLAVGQGVGNNPGFAPGTVITGINVGTKTVTVSNNFTGTTGVTSIDVSAWQSLGTGAVTLGGASTNGTLDLAGSRQVINALAVGGPVPGGSVASQTIGSSSTTGDATLVFNGIGSSIFGGTIRNTLGAGTRTVGLTVSGGHLSLTGANTFTGPTLVSGGELTVGVAGAGASASAVTVAGTGTLSGSGTVGAVTIDTGGTIAPGNSPGTLATGAQAWHDGGNYAWEINAADPSFGNGKGASTGYDWLNIAGALDLGAIASDFTIHINGLTALNTAGAVPGFTSGTNYDWVLATASGGIIGFDPADFVLDASAFLAGNPLGGGSFSIVQGGGANAGTSNDLILHFTAVPEPSTFGLMAIGAAMLPRRRRKA